METLIRDMESYAAAHRVPIIGAGARGVLLAAATEKRPRRILEVGTAIGYSALLLAASGAEDVQVTTIELSEERAAVARAFFARSEFAPRIRFLVGDAAELLPTLAGPFDFVFIDAAKGQYPAYLREILPLLLDGAVVAADNVLFRGYVRGGEKPPRRFKTIAARLRSYLDMVSRPPFVTVVHEDGDGLAVSAYRRETSEKT